MCGQSLSELWLVSPVCFMGVSTLLLWEIESWCSTRGNEASYQALGRSSISSPPSITTPQPTYGESRLRQVPFSSSSMSCKQCNVPNNACMPPASFSFNFSLYHFHLTPATHICIPSARQVWNLHLDTWLLTFPLLFKGRVSAHKTITLRNCSLFLPLQPRLQRYKPITAVWLAVFILLYFIDAAV